MVTKDHLAQLRAERDTPNARLEYHIDGPVRTQVVSSRAAEREREILLGERAMRDALRDMRYEHAMSRHHGQAKAIFNQSNDASNQNQKMEMKP